jgi:tRNA A37 threonylcarbamoyltransferase TsaD
VKDFPYLTLIATSSSTELLLCHSLTNITVLGLSIDISLGEAFDSLSTAFQWQDHQHFQSSEVPLLPLTPPLLDNPSCDFAFKSVLDQALSHVYPSRPDVKHEEPIVAASDLLGCRRLAASFQSAVNQQVCSRVRNAMQYCGSLGVRNFLFCGGVAENESLASAVRAVVLDSDWNLLKPPSVSDSVDDMFVLMQHSMIHSKAKAVRRGYSQLALGEFWFSSPR